MDLQIHRIRLGIVNCYLVRHSGTMLVDSGTSGSGEKIMQGIRALGLDPRELNLIVLTHGHADHIGSAHELVKKTGAKVAIHQEDQKWLVEGSFYPAKPVTTWAKFMVRLTSRMQAQFRFPGCIPDILFGEERYTLEEFGIPGEIVHTPGHTSGSVSVVLEDGSALVGDMAMNGFPSLKNHPALPFSAENLPELKRSWQRLLAKQVQMIYPGHGSPFPADAMSKISFQ